MSEYEGLPEKMRKQAEEAEAELKQSLAQHTDTPANPPEPVAVTTASPAPAEPPVVPTPATQEPEQPAPEQTPPAERKDWKQAFHTLRGKYDAEVPRLHAELESVRKLAQEQATTIARLTERLAGQPAAATPASPAPSAPVRRFVPDSARELVGPEIADMVDGAAQAVLPEVDSRIGKVQGELANTHKLVTKLNEDRYFDALSRSLPNWSEINSCEPWKEWLRVQDPMERPGVTRNDKLQDAFATYDVARTLAFFETFLAAHPELKGAGSGASQPAAQVPSSVPPPLASQRAPVQQRGQPPPNSPAIIKLSDYEKAMDPFVRGKMTEQERQKIQKEFDAALREGRVDLRA